MDVKVALPAILAAIASICPVAAPASNQPAWQRALAIRGDALNRTYHLGRYAVPRALTAPTTPAWYRALELRSRALNKRYGLGRFAPASVATTPVAGAERRHSATTPQAGPWYTPQELEASGTYSRASLAQKKTLPAETNPSSISVDECYRWGDAAVGAAVALACAGAAAALYVWRRGLRRRLRHT